MKNILTRRYIHALILFIGLILMAGGIITGKHGATAIGLIISAVNVQQWIQLGKKEINKNKNQS